VDSGVLGWGCTCRVAAAERECVHLRITAEWLLDVVHDTEHRLHEPLSTILGVPDLEIPRDALPSVLAAAARIGAHLGLDLDPSLGAASRPVAPDPVLRLEPLDGGGLEASLVIRTGDGREAHPPGDGPPAFLGVDHHSLTHWERDLEAERQAARSVVARLGLDGEVRVDGEAALLAALRRGERYVRLGPGRFALLEQELRGR
jgi:hypothetical protein